MALSIKDAKRGDHVQYIGYADFQDTIIVVIAVHYR